MVIGKLHITEENEMEEVKFEEVLNENSWGVSLVNYNKHTIKRIGSYTDTYIAESITGQHAILRGLKK